MLLLRREFSDGPDCPELVLLHYTVLDEVTGGTLFRASLVMPARPGEGTREVFLFLPESAPERPMRLRYGYSTVSGAREWFSPSFELDIASIEQGEGVVRLDGTPPGNLGPAAGLGMFRMRIPLRNPSIGAPVRYGFGAMRKKPSEALCRMVIPAGPTLPVVESPEALSVLKARPMPYYFYHVDPADGQLVQDKIAPARITFSDDVGDVVAVRMLWGDPAWDAANLTVMELKNYGDAPIRAADHFFAEDRDLFLAERRQALAAHPVPRVFEGYLAGPAGTEGEYCFQVVRRREDGALTVEWRNRDGEGNWKITF